MLSDNTRPRRVIRGHKAAGALFGLGPSGTKKAIKRKDFPPPDFKQGKGVCWFEETLAKHQEALARGERPSYNGRAR